MPKVKLSESELRKIILMSLQEADAPEVEPAAVGDEPQTSMFRARFVPTPSMLAEAKYLIDAQQALSRPFSATATTAATPKFSKSLKVMHDEVRVSTATGNLGIDWDTTVTASMAIYKAWLKLQIINTIADTTKQGRKFFHVGGTVYTTQALLANPTVVEYNKIAGAQKVAVTTPEFFGMLDDEAFVNKISKDASAAGTTQYLADGSAMAFIEEESLEPIKAGALAAANSAVTAMKDVWNQFNTDFVEEFFCLPVLLPNGVWKRASNTGDPRSTPWRMSYGVYNIASQAVGVRGGIAALYRKLYTYSNSGPSVQFVGRSKSADPYLTAGLFRESLEVRKTLMTVTELRRVIQAAFDVKLSGRGYRDAALEEAWAAEVFDGVVKAAKGIWKFGKRTFGLGEEMSDLEKLAAKSTQAATTITTDLTRDREVLEAFFQTVGLSEDGAKVAINSFVIPASALPPMAEMRFPQAVDKVPQSELYELTKKVLDEMAKGVPMQEIIRDMTKSSAFGAAEVANLGQAKRATLLRMIRIARDGGGFLTGANRTKTVFLEDLLVKTQRTFIDGFEATEILQLADGTTVSRTLTYDITQKSFIFNGYNKATSQMISNSPISVADAKLIFGDEQVDVVVDLMEGVMLGASGAKFKILDAFKVFQEANLVRAEDALIGMLANPTRANLSANRGAAEIDASKFQIGLDAIPNESSSIGRATEELQGLFGKYVINPKGQAFFKAITFVERNVIGGPVRGAARSVRNFFKGKGLLADICDAIATNGVYSYFLGYILLSAGLALGPDIKSTASKEDSVLGQILAVLSSGLNTSPIVPALANCLIDVIGKVFDLAVGGADENIQALFDAEVLLSAGDNLATALLAFGQMLDTRAENFPVLLVDAGGSRGVLKQGAEVAAETIKNGTIALSSNQEKTSSDAAAKLTAGVTAVQEIIGLGAPLGGNAAWASLQQSRSAAEKLTVDAVKATRAGLGGEVSPSIAAYSKAMTFDYKTIAAGDDTWLQMGNALTRILSGRDLSISMETWAWLKINAGRGTSIAPGAASDFASYLTDQGGVVKANSATIAIVNAQYAKLAELLSNTPPASTAPAPVPDTP